MSETPTEAAFRNASETSPGRKQGWFAAGGVIGAVLASTCCIAPLVLLTLGVSGAWIANLTSLEPFKPYFAAAALIFIGLGFRQVYLRPAASCAEGTYCAEPKASVIVKWTLWGATLLVVLALTVGWWAPLFY